MLSLVIGFLFVSFNYLILMFFIFVCWIYIATFIGMINFYLCFLSVWQVFGGVVVVCGFLSRQVNYTKLYYAEFGWVVMRLTFLTKNKRSFM